MDSLIKSNLKTSLNNIECLQEPSVDVKHCLLWYQQIGRICQRDGYGIRKRERDLTCQCEQLAAQIRELKSPWKNYFQMIGI